MRRPRDQPRLAGRPGGRPRGAGRDRRARRDPRGRDLARRGRGRRDRRPTGWSSRPGFIDLHAHLREPGNEDAETVASGPGGRGPRRVHDGLRDAEHDARARRAGRARRGSGRPRVASGRRSSCWPTGRSPSGGRARRWPRSASWPTPGSSGFSRRRGAGARPPRSCGTRWPTPGALGLPVVDHAEDPTLTDGRRGERRATSRPSSACAAGRSRPRRSAVRARPRGPRRRRPRRAGRAAPPDPPLDGRRRSSSSGARRRPGLPVTCDVTPHHLALTDEWLAGRPPLGLGRRAATRGPTGAIVAAPYDPSLRVNPPLRAPADAAACLAALRRRHGGRDRHRPRAAHGGRQGGRVRAGGQRDQRHRDGAGRRPRGGRRRAAAARAGRSRR